MEPTVKMASISRLSVIYNQKISAFSTTYEYYIHMNPIVIFLFYSLGSPHKPKRLYNRIGREASVQKITDNFTDPIGNDD